MNYGPKYKTQTSNASWKTSWKKKRGKALLLWSGQSGLGTQKA